MSQMELLLDRATKVQSPQDFADFLTSFRKLARQGGQPYGSGNFELDDVLEALGAWIADTACRPDPFRDLPENRWQFAAELLAIGANYE